jgi:hypothetical protein
LISLTLVAPAASAVNLEHPLELEASGRLLEALEAFEQAVEVEGSSASELQVIY